MIPSRDFGDGTVPASVCIEEPLCNYLATFDGTRKDFATVKLHFDALFSDTMIHLMDDGHLPVGKETFARINEYLLDVRAVATLEDIWFVDDTHVDYTVHWGNDVTSMVVHNVAVVADGKIIKVEPCQETKGIFAALSPGMRYRRVKNGELTHNLRMGRFRDGFHDIVSQWRGTTSAKGRRLTNVALM